MFQNTVENMFFELEIVLFNPSYKDIIIDQENANNMNIVGEFMSVLK
ncbi:MULTISPECIES: hypothetical protein [Tenacibaculum]|nr:MULTISPECIES: hypothetical protein [Tenacibaculum]MBE7628785.1 hypothetical protein [Tenacibaculum piscium]MCD8421594.1 hypothetical protein [Tenacibaculum finnmarkense genomovar ulcerans]MCG8784830.1 hypothetical protein [Tenacibaculum finnmarkense]